MDRRITKLNVWHLQLPINARRDHGIGSVEHSAVALGLGTECGTTGYGEASSWSVFTGSVEASFAALDRCIRPLVLGRRLSTRAASMYNAVRAAAYRTEAKATLDTALLELQGWAFGLLVWALLDRRCRDTIPLSCSIADLDFDNDLRLVAQLKADGACNIKPKAGFKNHAFDMMRLERPRDDFPEFGIRIDYNQGLHQDTVLACVRDMAQFCPTFIGLPVRAHLRNLMKRIRDAIDVPLLADESVFGPEDMQLGTAFDIADGVSTKIMKSGGLARAQTVDRMADGVGLQTYGGDMFESGLAHLARTHMIVATAEIKLGCEFYQASYFLTEGILAQPFMISDGQAVVLTAPSVDMGRLARHAIHHGDGDRDG